MENSLVFEPIMQKEAVTLDQRFRYGFVNGQAFISSERVVDQERFELVSIDIQDLLIPVEIIEVEESWREIREGRAKKFRSVDELLRELRE